MRFLVKGQSIHCVREKDLLGDHDNQVSREHIVTTFDARVDSVPPHVAAALLPEEVKQLEGWIEDRNKLHKKMKDEPLDQTILEALPGLLRVSRNAIRSAGRMDENLFHEITSELSEIKLLLDDFDDLTKKKSLEIDEMQSDEVLAEQLNVIKKNIDSLQ